jgi:hypothetical protein
LTYKYVCLSPQSDGDRHLLETLASTSMLRTKGCPVRGPSRLLHDEDERRREADSDLRRRGRRRPEVSESRPRKSPELKHLRTANSARRVQWILVRFIDQF